MPNTRRIQPIAASLAALALAGLPLSLAACVAKPREPLRIGTSLWTGYEPFFLARDRGYFDAETAKLVEYTSTTDSARAFRNGAVDAISVTLDEIVKLRRAGIDARVVLVIDVSHGADVILARPEIGSLGELRQKRLGIETTSLGDYMVARALETAGMKLDDVKVVPLEVSEHERAYKEGIIDAVVTYEPVRTRLLALGARNLFDSSRIPGEIVDVLAVQAHVAVSGREQLGKVLGAWFKAVDDIRMNRAGVVQAIASRERLGASDVEASLNGLRFPDLDENRALLGGPSPRLLDPAERLVGLMVQRRLVNERVNIRTALDGTHVLGIAR